MSRGCIRLFNDKNVSRSRKAYLIVRGWDLQDARGVEVATYADLYGEKYSFCAYVLIFFFFFYNVRNRNNVDIR